MTGNAKKKPSDDKEPKAEKGSDGKKKAKDGGKKGNPKDSGKKDAKGGGSEKKKSVADDPGIDKMVEDLVVKVRKVLFIFYLVVAFGLIPPVVLLALLLMILLDVMFGIPFNYLMMLCILAFLEVLAFVGYLFLWREVKQEIEEKVYLDNFLASFLTSTFGIVSKVTVVIMAVILVVGGVVAIIAFVQFGFVKISIGVCCFSSFLIFIGLLVVIVCAIVRKVLSFLIGKVISKVSRKLPFEKAKIVAKYTKVGEKDHKKQSSGKGR